jgi:hypothetical protein
MSNHVHLVLLPGQEDSLEILLRRCTYAGRPFGEEMFVQSMEQRFQRKWRRWSFEQAENSRAA